MQDQTIVAYCDGGARGNPGPGAAGCVITNSAEKVRVLCGKYLGRVTNNQAEYAAVVLALTTIKEKFPAAKEISFFLDSQLVVNQLTGLFKVKNPRLREIILEIRLLETGFKTVAYTYVRREKNAAADALVNKAIDEKSHFVLERADS